MFQAWLHHSIILNWGGQVKDYTCGRIIDNMFETGNERTDIEWAHRNGSFKTGYFIHPTDNFFINTELMNMDDVEKWVWLTFTYDYVDEIAKHPDYKDGRIVWMSIGPDRCSKTTTNPFGNSNLTESQQPKALALSEYSVPWVSPSDGHIIGVSAHMHDGGTATEVFLDGKSICNSLPKYARNGKAGMGYGGPAPPKGGPMGHGHTKNRKLRRQNVATGGMHNNNEIEHIEGQTPCFFDPPIPVKKDSKMFIRSDYDFKSHPG
jgi:hypothetical protein